MIDGRVRSELLKYFTTRLWWGMAIGIFVSGAAFALLFGLLYTSESYLDQSGDNPFGGAPTGDATQIANSVYTAGLSVGYLLMLVIGVIQIGAEYRHRTITSTFLTQPRRPQVMLGKVLALVLVAAAYGALSLIGSVLVGRGHAAGARGRGVPVGAGVPHPRAEPARARAVGPDRAGRRDPDPQPGGRAAHRGRRRLDRGADRRPGHQAVGLRAGSTSRRTSRARRARRSSTPPSPRPTTSGCRGGAERSRWWCGPRPSPASASCGWSARTSADARRPPRVAAQQPKGLVPVGALGLQSLAERPAPRRTRGPGSPAPSAGSPRRGGRAA